LTHLPVPPRVEELEAMVTRYRTAVLKTGRHLDLDRCVFCGCELWPGWKRRAQHEPSCIVIEARRRAW
jgi:hypothetical protein